MKRPSKKDIRAAVEKLKDHKAGTAGPEQYVPKADQWRPNKNRARKPGV